MFFEKKLAKINFFVLALELSSYYEIEILILNKNFFI